MKRFFALALALLLFVGMAPHAEAIVGKTRTTPIYTGFWDTDAVAEMIIEQTGARKLAGDYERIEAVYDWVMTNCSRAGDRDKEYITFSQLQKDSLTWINTLQDRLDRGEAALYSSFTDLDHYQDNGYNTGYNHAYLALDMGIYRVGDCLSFSALLAVLLQHMGYECFIIPGDFINSDGSHVTHKWNMVYIGDTPYLLDVRMDHQLMAAGGKASHVYFLKTDETEWGKKHEWNKEYTDALKNQHDMGRRAYYYGGINYAMLEAPSWTRCSPWAETYLSQARDVSMLPDCLKGQDMTRAISREEFASLAVSLYEKLSGQTAPIPDSSPFSDCDNEDVLKAYVLGIVNGDTATTFNPKGLLTREQSAAMLGRVYVAVKKNVDMKSGTDVTPFADDREIADYSRDFVYFLHAYGVIDGVGSNRFDPWGKTTREAAVKIAVLTYDLAN